MPPAPDSPTYEVASEASTKSAGGASDAPPGAYIANTT